MPKPLDAKLVRDTFKEFRGYWDWKHRPKLRIRLRRWSAFERGPDHDWSKPTRMEYAGLVQLHTWAAHGTGFTRHHTR